MTHRCVRILNGLLLCVSKKKKFCAALKKNDKCSVLLLAERRRCAAASAPSSQSPATVGIMELVGTILFALPRLSGSATMMADRDGGVAVAPSRISAMLIIVDSLPHGMVCPLANLW